MKSARLADVGLHLELRTRAAGWVQGASFPFLCY